MKDDLEIEGRPRRRARTTASLGRWMRQREEGNPKKEDRRGKRDEG